MLIAAHLIRIAVGMIRVNGVQGHWNQDIIPTIHIFPRERENHIHFRVLCSFTIFVLKNNSVLFPYLQARIGKANAHTSCAAKKIPHFVPSLV